MGLMTIVSGTGDTSIGLKELDPEGVVDFFMREFAASKARRTPEHSSQVRKEMAAAGIVRPAPGT